MFFEISGNLLRVINAWYNSVLQIKIVANKILYNLLRNFFCNRYWLSSSGSKFKICDFWNFLPFFGNLFYSYYSWSISTLSNAVGVKSGISMFIIAYIELVVLFLSKSFLFFFCFFSNILSILGSLFCFSPAFTFKRFTIFVVRL